MKLKLVLCATFVFCMLYAGAKKSEAPPVLSETIVTPGSPGAWTTKATFYSPGVVRITKYPNGIAPAKKSYSIIAQPKEVKAVENSTTAFSELSSESIKVRVNRQDGTVQFLNNKGESLLAETHGPLSQPSEHAVDAGKFKVSQGFSMPADEVIVGLGQRQNLSLNQRNEDVEIWSENTNVTIPYFASEKGYGLYWDNPGKSRFKTSAQGVEFESDVAPMVDYYFLYSDGSQDGVVAGIREITGQATMLPIKAFGHWQCRERYKSSDELSNVLDRYRELQIPLDGIVQDWQYWGCDSNWNAMRFMNPRYIDKMGDPKWMRYLPNGEDPNTEYETPRMKTPQDMVNYVHANNANLMISIWASFGPWTDQYRELEKIGALLPFDTWPRERGVMPYDPFNPKARDIYWKYLKHMYDMGFDAWWTDSTEPDHWEKPEDLDYMTHDGSWRSVKNAYPLVTNKGIYEHQRAVKGNDRRSMQMTRCGAFGMQHYGTFGWSGDVNSSWEVLKNQIPSGLNYVICGLPYWNTDIGGFFGWDYNNDPHNPAMQELQTRWMQWGTFMPMMRNHCSSPMVSELYNFGQPGDWAFDAMKKAIELRYRIMPYIYSLAGNVTQHDGTMMRPLIMDFPKDRKAIQLSDQYMFGPSFLVKPVTYPLYTWRDENRNGHEIYPDMSAAQAPVDVYLPEGSRWFDFYTNKLFDGGKTVKTLAPIDRMPVYIKAGSIVPFGPSVQYTGQEPWDTLEIRVYPGENAEFTLYEDDGETYGYERGEFSEIPMKWNDAEKTLTIESMKGSYPEMLKERKFNIILVDETTAPGNEQASISNKTVTYSGNPVSIKL